MGLFDFNDDGHTGFFEGLAGASFLSGLGGLITSQNDAENVAREQLAETRRLREDLERRAREEEREREKAKEEAEKQAMNELLFGDGSDEDFYDELDDFEYDGPTTKRPNPVDLENARRVANHLKSDLKAVEYREHFCNDCVFWHGSKASTTRGYGCSIWYLIQIEYGGSIPDTVPSYDEKTCSHFALGTGVPTTCYDCVHWKHSLPTAKDIKRPEGCGVWVDVEADVEDLKEVVLQKFGYNVGFTAISPGLPWHDQEVCFKFELDPALEAGHGKQILDGLIAEDIKSRATTTKESRRVYVAGIPFGGRAEIWKCALVDGETDIALVPEPNNAHDPNAIAVYIGSEHGGYLPAEEAARIAKGGLVAEVEKFDITVKPDKANPAIDKVYVWLTLSLSGGTHPTSNHATSGRDAYSNLFDEGVYAATDEMLDVLDLPDEEILEALRALRHD